MGNGSIEKIRCSRSLNKNGTKSSESRQTPDIFNAPMLMDSKEDVIVPVKVTPKARENRIVGWENGQLKIKVTAAPEKGEANQGVIILLANLFHVPQRDVILLHGGASRSKLFCLSGLTKDRVLQILSI